MDDYLFDTTTEVPETTTQFDEYYLAAETQISTIYRIFMELYTVLALVCVAVDILMIYVISKYRRLRNNKANVILLNWAVLNSFFMITQPTTLRISIFWVEAWSFTTFHILEQVEYTALSGNVLLIMLLFIYWFLKVYYPARCVKFENHIRVVLGIFYLSLLFVLILNLQAVFNEAYFMFVAEIFLILLYLTFIVFMIIMNLTHFIKKRKLIQTTPLSNTPMILSNVFFLSIVPLLIVLMVHFSTRIGEVAALVLIDMSLILAVMNPIYFFFVLYKCDRDFKTFFGYVFSCQCRKYDDEMLEEPVVFNGNVQM